MSPIRLYILECVTKGYDTERGIARALNVDKRDVRRNVTFLKDMAYLRSRGILMRRLRLTAEGYDILNNLGHAPQIPIHEHRIAPNKQKIEHTTTIGTALKVGFGLTLGKVIAIILIGFLISLVYHFGFLVVVQQGIVPDWIASHLPFNNFIINFILGCLTAIVGYLKLRKGG